MSNLMKLRVDDVPPETSYRAWLDQLIALATQQDIEWIISLEPAAHRESFDKGLSPDEELAGLAAMAEWRGCGCGGG